MRLVLDAHDYGNAYLLHVINDKLDNRPFVTTQIDRRDGSREVARKLRELADTLDRGTIELLAPVPKE